MLFLHDELCFKKLIYSFVVRPSIRRNKSNKAFDLSDDDITRLKESAEKECNQYKSKVDFHECMANFYVEFDIPNPTYNPDISGTSDGGKSYF